MKKIQELVNGLPSKLIQEKCAILAIKHPKTNELIVLKNRFDQPVLEEELEFYDKIHNPYHDYSELEGKKIMLDWHLLNSRGLKQLIYY